MVTRQSLLARQSLRALARPVFVASLALLSCSNPKADNAAGSDLGAPTEATQPSTPDPSAPNGVQEIVPTPTQTSPDTPTAAPTTPAMDLAPTEESAAPTPESAQAALSMEDRVTPLVNAIAGAKLLFVACDAEPCTLRVQTTELRALHEVLTTLSREFSGNIAFAAREQLDAYTGRSFQADVPLDVVEGSQPVPDDESELITTR